MATKGSFVLEDRRIKRYVMGENTNKRSKAITMTSGSLWKNIFLFSVPLMFSQILEIMFNLSDVAVVGQFADYKALGAVGSTTLLVTLFTSFLIGMGSGVNVQVALGLGANNKKAVEKTIHSALLICAFVESFVPVRVRVAFVFRCVWCRRRAAVFHAFLLDGLPVVSVYECNGVCVRGPLRV
mgnify:CR=1 FL=1